MCVSFYAIAHQSCTTTVFEAPSRETEVRGSKVRISYQAGIDLRRRRITNDVLIKHHVATTHTPDSSTHIHLVQPHVLGTLHHLEARAATHSTFVDCSQATRQTTEIYALLRSWRQRTHDLFLLFPAGIALVPKTAIESYTGQLSV